MDLDCNITIKNWFFVTFCEKIYHFQKSYHKKNEDHRIHIQWPSTLTLNFNQ